MPNSRVIAGLASAVSLVAGIGIGHWLLDERALDRPTSVAAAPAATRSESEALLAILRELHRGLDAMTRALEREALVVTPRVETPTREPAGREAPTPVATGDLPSALRALASAVAEMRPRSDTQRGPDPQELAIPAWVDREAAFAATGMREAALTGNEDLLEREQHAFRVKHLFETYQEVLSAYGAPDDINLENTTRWWNYENRFEGGRETFCFGFDDGTVYEAGYNFEPEH